MTERMARSAKIRMSLPNGTGEMEHTTDVDATGRDGSLVPLDKDSVSDLNAGDTVTYNGKTYFVRHIKLSADSMLPRLRQ